jgi:hypothetical protein
MTRPAAKGDRRAVVIHSNQVVADDLVDILRGAGMQDVQSARSLCAIVPGPAEVVVFEGPMARLVGTEHLFQWSLQNVPLILLSGTASSVPSTRNVRLVQQPFRSEDILGALKSFFRH